MTVTPRHTQWYETCRDFHHTFVVDLKNLALCSLEEEHSPKNYLYYLKGVGRLYEAFEKRLEELKEEPLIAPFYDARILRSQPIQEDLTLFKENGIVVHLTKKRQEKLAKTCDKIAQMEPARLLAWVYNGLGAPIAGGQRSKQRFVETPKDSLWQKATHFYEYEIGDTKEYSGKMKQALNALVLSEENHQAFLDESKRVFRKFQGVLNDLKEGDA